MKTVSKRALILVGVIAIFVGAFFALNSYIYNEKQAGEITSEASSYFQERLQALGIDRVGRPIEGFDVNLLMAAFPGLVSLDFNGVEAMEGHYRLGGDKIEFVPTDQQMMTSAAGTVSDEGYSTLLENVAVRLNMPVMSNVTVDDIVKHLSKDVQIDTLSIKLGERGESTLGIQITALELLEDSRCPNPVNCIQAGTVRVRATLESGLGTAEQIFELNQPVTTEVEEVTLSEVDPWPSVDQSIEDINYVFHFEIKKR